MNQKKLPVGISDYKNLVDRGRYFVDKTLFIKEVFENPSEVLLLPRPRRFGKTLNLSMLKYYCDMNETEQERLFQGYDIIKEKELNDRYMGKFPVIFLTFKDFKDATWDNCFKGLKRLISKLCDQYSYLLDSPVLSEIQKKIFHQIINLEADQKDYENCLENLTLYLERFHNKKVVLLIDEYDAPIHSGDVKGYYDEIIDFMRMFLGGGLKDNSALHKAVVTGILRVAKESIFSGVNNLDVLTINDIAFSDKFGFTEAEVKTLLNDIGMSQFFDTVREWYNGYIFGNHTIYNPWSIISFGTKKVFKTYWGNTSSNDIIASLMTNSKEGIRKQLEVLLSGGGIIKEIQENIVLSRLGHNEDAIFSFLYLSGYLKASPKEPDNPENQSYIFSVPNFEIMEVLRDLIKNWIQEGLGSESLYTMLNALTNGNIAIFTSYLQKFVINMMSFHDTGKVRDENDTPERVYQAFILGLLVLLEGSYEVTSNRESGLGRYDVMMIPKDSSKKGIVMELKKASNNYEEIPEKDLEEALAQIEEKRYEQELRNRGVQDIMKLGIAFEGKKVWVRSNQ